ncbi:MAG: putative rane protein [Firmicutes bacterium]|nr:putative rane protein [Bacillota bacterium]
MRIIDLSILEPILRTILTFLVVLAMTRILGRKQISQLTFFDYVAGTAIGSLSASAMSNNSISLLTDLLCFITWTLLIISMNLITLHSAPARKLLDDQPRVVIRDGKILENNLGCSFYTVSDLLMQLREKEVFDPNEIDVGILETNGELSILKKTEYQTITAKDLNISNQTKGVVASQYTGKELVINGEILQQNLSSLGISEQWLKQQLQAQGVNEIKAVTLATLIPGGKLYIDMELDQ